MGTLAICEKICIKLKTIISYDDIAPLAWKWLTTFSQKKFPSLENIVSETSIMNDHCMVEAVFWLVHKITRAAWLLNGPMFYDIGPI